MRFLLFNHIENARESMRNNRTRTFLTILGITLGVACMTTILALSTGASQLISNQVHALGGNIAVLRPGAERHIKDLRDVASPISNDSFTTSSLTEKDYTDIQKMEGVADVAPLMSISGTVKAGTTALSLTPIVATTPDLQKVANLHMKEGQFIDNVTNKNTVVIGKQLSVNLFGTDQSTGYTLYIRGQPFVVIGILKKTDDSVNYDNLNYNEAAIINLESGKSFNQGVAQIKQIDIRAKDPTQLQKVVQTIEKTIKTNHMGEKDFRVLTGNAIARPTSSLFNAVGLIASVVSGVALLIGGIGIMNIMLVSVAERTREIGIRKAVGASSVHITMQFLIESLVMSLSGGITGFILGYLVAFFIGIFLPFTPLLSWQIAAGALSVSVFVGTIFGLYPALRAARKNPIEALRQYH